MSVSAALLRSLSLFKGLTPKELEVLGGHIHLPERRMTDVLFSQGDVARSCLIIVEGRVGVFVGQGAQEEQIVALKDGAILGHMALVDGKRRSATCRVTSAKATIIELRHEEFAHLFNAQSPFAYKILDNLVMDLVGMLRTATTKLEDARQSKSERIKQKKIRDAAAHLAGTQDDTLDTSMFDVDDMDVDSVEVCYSSMEQRMRDKRGD